MYFGPNILKKAMQGYNYSFGAGVPTGPSQNAGKRTQPSESAAAKGVKAKAALKARGIDTGNPYLH